MADDGREESDATWLAGAAVFAVTLGLIARRTTPAASVRGTGRGTGSNSIPKAERGWKGIVVGVYRSIGGDRVLETAAGVTFFVLLAVFPTIAVVVSIYGLFADPLDVSRHLAAAGSILPGGGIEILREQMTRIASRSGGALSLGLALGLAVSLWSANSGMKALFDALNVAYGEPERRGFFALNAMSLAFTAGAIVFLLLAIGALVAVPVLLDLVSRGGSAPRLIDVLRWPALLLIASAALGLVYRYGPSRQRPRWRWLSWGSAVGAVLWLTASALFSWYAANFGSYDRTYGSLGAAVGFMTWIWISTIIVLMGAELDAEIEHRRAPDSAAQSA